MADDFFDEAKKKFKEGGEDSYAETWRPEEGDTLEGIVVRGDYVLTRNSETPVHLIVIKDRETEEDFTVWCSATVLKGLVMDLAPKPGTKIVIQYEGKVLTKSGDRSYGKWNMAAEATDFAYWHDLVSKYHQKAKMLGEQPMAPSVVRNPIGADEEPF
jgi:hypothetical protein